MKSRLASYGGRPRYPALGPDFVFDFFLDQGIKSYGVLPAKPQNAPTGAPAAARSTMSLHGRWKHFLVVSSTAGSPMETPPSGFENSVRC